MILSDRDLRARIDAAPKTPEGRLEAWHSIGGPQIHHRLSKFARFTPELPWLVTHAIQMGDGQPPELWGIDCEALPMKLSHLEDMTVVIELPQPRLLGRHEVVGDMVEHVPLISPDTDFDAGARLAELGVLLLEHRDPTINTFAVEPALEFRYARIFALLRWLHLRG